MSQLFVVTRPALVPGFQLAGVDAHGVEDAGSAQELIEKWLTADEVGLLGIRRPLESTRDRGPSLRRPVAKRRVHEDYSRKVAQGGLSIRPGDGSGQAASGSIPSRSLTATRSFCLHPR